MVFVRVINLMLQGRRVFTEWLRRAICPIPKIPGNPDVALSRPLTLLSVSGKVFWAVITDRITAVWRENDLLQKQQYGFQRGISSDEPLLIATLVAEQCYDLQQPLITLSQDISKAFDSVSRSFKTMAFSRLGLPDDFCELFASMDEGNKTVVLTGTFECLRMVRHRKFLVKMKVHSSACEVTHKDALHLLLLGGRVSMISYCRYRMI